LIKEFLSANKFVLDSSHLQAHELSMWEVFLTLTRHPEGNSHLPKGARVHMHVFFSISTNMCLCQILKQMVGFFLGWKSLNISFDEPTAPSLTFYDFFFFFLNLYIVLAPPKPIYTLTTYHIYIYIKYIHI